MTIEEFKEFKICIIFMISILWNKMDLNLKDTFENRDVVFDHVFKKVIKSNKVVYLETVEDIMKNFK